MSEDSSNRCRNFHSLTYMCAGTGRRFILDCMRRMMEDVFYRDKIVRASDRAEWNVSINGATPIRARIGAGMEPLVNEPAVRIESVSGLNGNVRNIACMELPAKLFGKTRFRAGDKIDLDSTFFTHCRAYRVEWRGQFQLGE